MKYALIEFPITAKGARAQEERVMAEKTKTVVRIAGNEYALSAEASEEYIHRIALYVDRKMSHIQRNRMDLSTAMIAVLAAVNITSELFAARGESDPGDFSPHEQRHAALRKSSGHSTDITSADEIDDF